MVDGLTVVVPLVAGLAVVVVLVIGLAVVVPLVLSWGHCLASGIRYVYVNREFKQTLTTTGCHQTKGIMSRTIALYMHVKSCKIS